MEDTTDPQPKHVQVIQTLRSQRYKLLQDLLRLRATMDQPSSLRSLCQELLKEIRALDAALVHMIMADQQTRLIQAVQFYADPMSYLAIGFFPDRPCGEFIEDFEDTEFGLKPGKRAREALRVLDR